MKFSKKNLKEPPFFKQAKRENYQNHESENVFVQLKLSQPIYSHRSLQECFEFVDSAPKICMPRTIDKLNYVVSYLRERGAEGFSIFPTWNPKRISGDLEEMALDALEHLRAISEDFYKVDLIDLRI